VEGVAESGKLTPDEILAVYAAGGSELFQPEVDRMLLALNHVPDEGTGGQLQRAERFLHLLPAARSDRAICHPACQGWPYRGRNRSRG